MPGNRWQQVLQAGSRRLLLLLGLAWPAAPAFALDPDRPFSQYAHERWSVHEGLPFPGGYELAQDGEGHLWLGSLSGLARFDGQRFVIYDSETTPALGGNLVYGLRTDPLGRLWVGTELGASIYHRGTFTALAGFRGAPARVLGMDRGLMLVSNGDAVLGVDESLQVRTHYPVPRANAFGRFGNTLWISTDNLVYRIDDGQPPQPAQFPALGQGFVEGFLVHAGRIWAQSTAGMYAYDGREWRLHPDPRLRRRIISMLRDRDGNFWVGTELNLVRVHGDQVVEDSDLTRMAKAPRRLFEDRDGSLWIASHASGLHRFWNGVADYIPLHIAPEDTPYMWALVPWQGGIITGGSYGLAITRGGRLQQVPGTEGLPLVYSLAVDGDSLLVGTVRGVYRYHADGRLEFPPELEELRDTRGNTFLRDRQDRLWIGTSRGLYRLDPGQPLRRITGTDNSNRWEVRKLLQTRDGRIFAAATAGLSELAGDQARMLPLPEPGMIVMAVHETASGALLVGSKSSGRLYLQSQRHWLPLGRQRGIPSNDVYSIIPDDQGNLLVTGLRGAYLVSERQLLEVATDPQAMLRVQGLLTLSRQFAPGQEAVCCLGGGDGRGFYADGQFFLPVSEGLYRVSPPAATTPVASSPRIERLATGGRPDLTGQALTVAGLRLQPEERDLQLEFGTISLAPLHAPRLQYRLQGYDRHWRVLAPRTQPQVQYTNLPPGQYRFEVMDAAAPAPQRVAALEFQIAPYFHETWWFRALTGALVLLGLALVVRQSNRAHRLRQLRLEEEVGTRTAELRQAYDRLESISRTDALTGINNRRHASEEIPARLERLQRLRRDAAAGRARVAVFALLDIDHFKSINDRWGHHHGDQVLQEVARRLRQQVRAGDCLARWGGEEFLLVCFELEPDQYASIGERLCASVRGEPVWIDGQALQVSISAGLARVPHDAAHDLSADWEQIVRTADRALYMAKARGRDGWVMLDAWEEAGQGGG
mgnify:CR=1 FL=1